MITLFRFSKVACAVVLVTGLLGTAQLDAQEQEAEIPSGPAGVGVIQMRTSDGSGEVQNFSIMTADMPSSGMLASDVMAFSPAMDEMGMLTNSHYQQELGLADEQIQEIKDLNNSFSERMKKMLQSEDGHIRINDATNLKKMIDDFNQEKKEKIKSVLLPAQLERLAEVKLQNKMAHQGGAATLTDKQLAEKLGISDEQKERIKDRAKELREKLEEDIAKLREKAREDLLDELDSDQRNTLNEMLGDKFELKPESLRDRIQKTREGESKDKD